jgi:hypothetical protein
MVRLIRYGALLGFGVSWSEIKSTQINAVIKPQGREVVMLVSPALRPNQDTGNAVLVIENSPWHSVRRTNDAATIPGIVRMGCIRIPVYGKIYQLNQRQVVLVSQNNSTVDKI